MVATPFRRFVLVPGFGLDTTVQELHELSC
jgi:hypothetical protein